MKSLFILSLLFLTSCSIFKKKEEIATQATKATILNSDGLKMFSTTTEGPFRIEIEGANVYIKMLKEESKIKVEKENTESEK
jgi:hypothetical protein